MFVLGPSLKAPVLVMGPDQEVPGHARVVPALVQVVRATDQKKLFLLGRELRLHFPSHTAS